MGLDSYDPFQIVEITKGRVYGDGQWLARMDQKGIDQIDCILKKRLKKQKKNRRKHFWSLLICGRRNKNKETSIHKN